MNQYQSTYISTNTTTHIATSGNITVHTVTIPKTTSGTVTFQSIANSPATYFVFPTSTIAGSYRLDVVCPNGLDVVTSASDVVIVSTQTP